MDTPCETQAQQDCSDPTVEAVITIYFMRLWDLLSFNQRQYALHLTDPTSHPAATPSPSLLTAHSWVDLPQSVRIAVLEEFKKLPGVFRVSVE